MDRMARMFFFSLAFATACSVAGGTCCLGACGATQRKILVHHLPASDLIALKSIQLWLIVPPEHAARSAGDPAPCTRCQGRPVPSQPEAPEPILSRQVEVPLSATPSCIAFEAQISGVPIGTGPIASRRFVDGILRPPIAALSPA